MTLKPNQICPHSMNCKYHNKSGSFCQGANPSRSNIFECNYVDIDGNNIKEGKARSAYDITGNMELIQE